MELKELSDQVTYYGSHDLVCDDFEVFVQYAPISSREYDGAWRYFWKFSKNGFSFQFRTLEGTDGVVRSISITEDYLSFEPRSFTNGQALVLSFFEIMDLGVGICAGDHFIEIPVSAFSRLLDLLRAIDTREYLPHFSHFYIPNEIKSRGIPYYLENGYIYLL